MGEARIAGIKKRQPHLIIVLQAIIRTEVRHHRVAGVLRVIEPGAMPKLVGKGVDKRGRGLDRAGRQLDRAAGDRTAGSRQTGQALLAKRHVLKNNVDGAAKADSRAVRGIGRGVGQVEKAGGHPVVVVKHGLRDRGEGERLPVQWVVGRQVVRGPTRARRKIDPDFLISR